MSKLPSPCNAKVCHLHIFFNLHAPSTEQPTCPVYLERLDQDTSGILTTICNHSFHCSCISKWADSSCPHRVLPTWKMFCGNNRSSIKQVNIDAEMLEYYSEPPAVLLSWLQELANVKSLTVSASTLQDLNHPHPFPME
ncbi:unnamed protein product [Vicia faba]|uniref:RING-type domain-containing protein n=1 Tax=Vicia faba TaxID=3906 RepID=A0AAV1AZC5_VICFA|nr:unnamed protein product [Vicia faba]